LQLLTAGYGPTLPTWALHQVGSFLGYTGRTPNVAAKAARDPQQTSGRDSQSGYVFSARPGESTRTDK